MNNSLVITIIIVSLILIWGIFGGIQTKNIGYTCNLGSPGLFCIAWQENIIGTFGRALDDFSNSVTMKRGPDTVSESTSTTGSGGGKTDTRTPLEKMEDGIERCNENDGIVWFVSKDGGVYCESGEIRKKEFLDEGYGVINEDFMILIQSCLEKGEDAAIYPNAVEC